MDPNAVRKFYYMLGLEPGATWADIKKAHRQRAQFFRPDKHAGDPALLAIAANEMKKINAAYQTLRVHLEVSAESKRPRQQPRASERRGYVPCEVESKGKNSVFTQPSNWSSLLSPGDAEELVLLVSLGFCGSLITMMGLLLVFIW